MLLIEVVTLFPEMIRESLLHGVVGRAQRRGLLRVSTEDPRRHTADVHHTVDDRPYGGGPGMVMKPEPLSAAIGAARARVPAGSPVAALSAQGERLTQQRVRALAGHQGLVLVAGRYEGMDERVLESEVDLELSIGDYVLSGGELPALVLIDALARLLPGALCCPAITPRLSAGGASRRWAAPGCGVASCWMGWSWTPKARRCCGNFCRNRISSHEHYSDPGSRAHDA